MKNAFNNIFARTYQRLGLKFMGEKRQKPRHSSTVGNVIQDELIICNFCGTIFRRTAPNHPEFLACPYCLAIARERVVYQCILDELRKKTGVTLLFFRQVQELRNCQLLECSPRPSEHGKWIYDETLGKYISSDFDMSAHAADVKIDLTDDQDAASFQNTFDIIICAHVLEHISDYLKALRNLHSMLATGGFAIVQVPILESKYTPVTWDEFHGDNTRVYHRFGFDLLFDLDDIFSNSQVVVGQLNFQITSPEIDPGKYAIFDENMNRCRILGESIVYSNGLGIPDLCDAFIVYK